MTKVSLCNLFNKMTEQWPTEWDSEVSFMILFTFLFSFQGPAADETETNLYTGKSKKQEQEF